MATLGHGQESAKSGLGAAYTEKAALDQGYLKEKHDTGTRPQTVQLKGYRKGQLPGACHFRSSGHNIMACHGLFRTRKRTNEKG